jgi:hypothetical protein
MVCKRGFGLRGEIVMTLNLVGILR